MSEPGDKAAASKVPGREPLRAPLPKRFYKRCRVREEPTDGFAILLDGRPVRTPKKLPLLVPTRALAEAIAEEWAAQSRAHRPRARMPLSKLAITTIDGVAENMPEVAADIVRFAGSDLLCYRAEAPAALADAPGERGIRPCAGSRRRRGAALPAGRGRDAGDAKPGRRWRASRDLVDPVRRFRAGLPARDDDADRLGVPRPRRRQGAACRWRSAWAAAHLDEDWQIARWGIDVEAADRRERRGRRCSPPAASSSCSALEESPAAARLFPREQPACDGPARLRMRCTRSRSAPC